MSAAASIVDNRRLSPSAAGAIWAVCSNTITMTMRRRAPMVLLLFAVIGAPVLSLFAEGDNTLVGLLKLVLTYNFTIMSGLLMMLVMYLSSTVLDSDISNKQIFMVDVKPVRRWQLLAGKWLGLVILSAWLLLIMVAITYVVLMALAATRAGASAWVIFSVLASALLVVGGILVYNSLVYRWMRVPVWYGRIMIMGWVVAVTIGCCWIVRAKRPRLSSRYARAASTFGAHKSRWSTDDIYGANNEFLVSRVSVFPDAPDIDAEVAKYREWLKSRGGLPSGQWKPDELKTYLRKVLKRKLWPIKPGQVRIFTFRRMPVPGARVADITIRYKFYGHAETGGASWLLHSWEFYNPRTGLAYQHAARSKSGKYRTFNVPARIVGNGDRLEVAVGNITPPNKEKAAPRIDVPLGRGIEVLVPSGEFWGNLVRGAILLWIRLAMIAAMGLAVNTFLRGPIAAFFVLGVLAVGMANGFVYKIVAPKQSDPVRAAAKPKAGIAETAWSKLGDAAEKVSNTVLPPILRVMPDFDQTDPTNDLILGREIPLRRLLLQALFDLGLRAGVLVLIGVFAFYRKEVGLPVIS